MPIFRDPGVTEPVEPEFLYSNDVPICGVNRVNNVLLCDAHFVCILLPDA